MAVDELVATTDNLSDSTPKTPDPEDLEPDKSSAEEDEDNALSFEMDDNFEDASTMSDRPSTSKGKQKESRGEAVKVCLRFRPESGKEAQHTASSCVRFSEDPSRCDVISEEKHRTFNFSRVFQPHATQEEVYDYLAGDMVDGLMEGINAAVIAYGQTGAGKTYSMFGRGMDGNKKIKAHQRRMIMDQYPEDQGTIPRMMRDVFAKVNRAPAGVYHSVRCSYVEVFMEKVYDLLAPKKGSPLRIRQDKAAGLWVTAATEVRVDEVDQVLDLIEQGTEKRVTEKTEQNELSSRGHAIVVVTITTHDTREAVERRSQLYLVDLAGSEKVKKSETTGDRLEEAKTINVSLLQLGNVIQALAKGKRHVPYRNSKLTRILQNSFGGNSRTALLLNCSPSSYNDRETLSTCRFGDRSQLIRNQPKANSQKSVAELEKLLVKANAEIEDRKLQILSLEAQLARANQALAQHKCESDPTSGGNCKPRTRNEVSTTAGASTLAVPSTTTTTATTLKNIHDEHNLILVPAVREKNTINNIVVSESKHLLSCPITNCVMKDPVVAMDGITYERQAIVTWMKKKDLESPSTGKTLSSKLLVDNHNLKRIILDVYPDVQSTWNEYEEYLSADRLPLDSVELIFTWLDAKSLLRCSQVCRDWRELANMDFHWERLRRLDFPSYKEVDAKVDGGNDAEIDGAKDLYIKLARQNAAREKSKRAGIQKNMASHGLQLFNNG